MRTYRRLRVQLTKQDEKELRGLLQGGIQQVRVVLRALVLAPVYNARIFPGFVVDNEPGFEGVGTRPRRRPAAEPKARMAGANWDEQWIRT